MKYGQFRALLSECNLNYYHERGRYRNRDNNLIQDSLRDDFSNLFFNIIKNTKEIDNLNEFYEHTKTKDGNDEILGAELFDLMNVLTSRECLNSKNAGVKRLIDEYNKNTFFILFYNFSRLGIITKLNINQYYRMSNDTMGLFYYLFIDGKGPKIQMFNVLIQDIFVLLDNNMISSDRLSKLLVHLDIYALLTSQMVKFIHVNREHIKLIADYFLSLKDENIRNFASSWMVYLNEINTDQVPAFLSLLRQLNDKNLTLDGELIRRIIKNKNFTGIDEFVNFLDAHKLLTEENLLACLSTDEFDFKEAEKIISWLQDKSLLDSKTFETIGQYNKNSITYLPDVLEMLDRHNLLKRESIAQMPNNIAALFIVFNYCKWLNAPAEIYSTILLAIKDDVDGKQLASIERIIFSFNDAKIKIPLARLQTILTAKATNLSRMEYVFPKLAQRNMLDATSCEQVFKQILTKLDNPSVSNVKVESMPGVNSEHYILNGNLHFYTKSNGSKLDAKSGSFGDVKKGFSDSSCTQPLFAIKSLKSIDPNGNQRSITDLHREAKKEAKYNKMLNRPAFFYHDNTGTSHIVSPWVAGKGLDEYTKNELVNAPLIDRLHCLQMIMDEIRELHIHYRMHCDIKVQNVIIDLQNQTGHLIDMGGCNKVGTMYARTFTDGFTDYHFNFSSDIYALGIVTAFLFPDLFKVEERVEIDDKKKNYIKCIITFIAGNPTTELINAIKLLVDTMIEPECHKRCSIEDAIEFCRVVVNEKNSVDQTMLNELSARTLKRPHDTVLDVIRRIEM